MKTPKLSVVMSTYKETKTEFKKTVGSVLRQTFKDFEFIIISDYPQNSDFEYIKKLKDKRIIIIQNKTNLGLTKSLNKGIKKAKGDYIARIDVGDTCSRDRLEKQAAFLDSNPDYVLVGSWVEIVQQGKVIRRIQNKVTDKELRAILPYKNNFVHSSIMYRRSMIGSGYDETFKRAQDYELTLRLASKHKVHNIPEYLIQYGLDESSISYGKSAKEQERYALKANFRAFFKYGYPLWKIIFIARGIVHYMIPTRVKLWVGKRVLSE